MRSWISSSACFLRWALCLVIMVPREWHSVTGDSVPQSPQPSRVWPRWVVIVPPQRIVGGGEGGVSAKETFTKFLAPREHSIQGWLPFPFLEARRRGGEGASVRDLFRHTAVIHLGFGRGDSVPRSCPAVCTSTLLPDCSPTGTGVSLPEQSNGIWGLVVESHIPVGYSSFS